MKYRDELDRDLRCCATRSHPRLTSFARDDTAYLDEMVARRRPYTAAKAVDMSAEIRRADRKLVIAAADEVDGLHPQHEMAAGATASITVLRVCG